MDTNQLSDLIQALHPPAKGIDPTIVYIIGSLIALVTAWNAKRGEDTHKAVNSTASKLAEDKKIADAAAINQAKEIASLREELRGLREKTVSIPITALPTPQISLPVPPVPHTLSDADITAIIAKMKEKL